MKKENFNHCKPIGKELSQGELLEINGGEDGDLAYYAGYAHVFTTAHILTGGLSTFYYLYKKVTS